MAKACCQEGRRLRSEKREGSGRPGVAESENEAGPWRNARAVVRNTFRLEGGKLWSDQRERLWNRHGFLKTTIINT